MNGVDIEHRLRRIVCDISGSDIGSDLTLSDFDSLELFEFVMAVEEEFQIKLEDEEVDALARLDEIVSLVSLKMDQTFSP